MQYSYDLHEFESYLKSDVPFFLFRVAKPKRKNGTQKSGYAVGRC